MKYGVSKESAKKWAEKVVESYKKTDEYKKEKAEMDKEFQDFILYGTPTTWFDNDTLQEIKDFNKDR
jgi:hypothetical protein